MTQFFYSDHIFNETIILPEDEAHHALKVVRKHKGDIMTVVDGKGGWYKTVIETDKIQNCKLKSLPKSMNCSLNRAVQSQFDVPTAFV